MYYGDEDYENMKKLAISIYLDYGIKEFPIDEKKICNTLGINLIPYSAFKDSDIPLFEKKSQDAFYIPMTSTTAPVIYYNDKVTNKYRIRYSIFHEVKHFVNNDTEETYYNEDMANFFSRYFMCPIPCLIHKKIKDINTIMSTFEISFEAANNALNNVLRRTKKFGNKIFDYEQPLIDLIYNTK